MSELNLYISKAYAEHPLGLWSFDYIENGEIPQNAGDEVATITGTYTEGVPMVYGSSKSIRLFEGAKVRYPSYGMFDENGKHNSYTADMWLRVDARTNQPRQIWGTASGDGLWVDDSYLTLAVGEKSVSYSIENWYRPMLVSVIYTPEKTRLIINGESVLSLKNNNVTFGGGDLFFTCPTNVELLELDCFAIYPYVVPDIALRRRFVWGQGVSSLKINPSIYDTETAYLNYPFADYANNFIYPEQASWKSGYSNGLIDNGLSLQTPTYQLPEIFDSNNTLESLYAKNKALMQPFQANSFTFNVDEEKPQESYMRFSDMSQLTTPIQAVYAKFGKTTTDTKQTLILFKKTKSQDFFHIYIEGDTVYYAINDTVLYTRDSLPVIFTVGLDLNAVIKSDKEEASNFFKSIADIEIWLMGDGANTFEGKLYSFGFIDSFVMSRQNLTGNFTNGVAHTNAAFDKFVSYTLMPYYEYGDYTLDISAAAYWEDTIPLALLGKANDDERKLNFMQINYGYDGDYAIKDGVYTFDNCELEAYVGFDELKNYPEKSLWNHDSVVDFDTTKVVRPQTDNWNTSVFEINSGAVVYPPPVNFWDVKMTVYFDIQAKAVNRRRFAIKNLAVASQAHFEDEARIGTESGQNLYSSGSFAITKENVPYLYLTKDSGIEPLDAPVRMPFNENQVTNYYINMVNMWVKPNLLNMNDERFVMVEVNGTEIGFLVESINDDNVTFMFGSTDGENREDKSQAVRVFKNGIQLETDEKLTLDNNQWSMIGIEFMMPLTLFGMVGNINLYPGAVYQNIQVTHIPEGVMISSPDFRIWDEVKPQTFAEWYAQVVDWYNLWIEKSGFSFPISTGSLYSLFIGRNSYPVYDNNLLLFNAAGMGIGINADWEVYNRRPA